MQVGEKYKTKHWGEVEVLEILPKRMVKIVFLNTGHIKSTRKDALEMGYATDSEAEEGGMLPEVEYKKVSSEDAYIPSGTVFESKNWGKFEVVEYLGSKNIKIRFLATGCEQVTQRYTIENGLVKDYIAEAKIKEEKRLLEEEQKRQKEKLREEAKLERLRKDKEIQEKRRKEKELKQAELHRRRLEKAEARNAEFVGFTNTDTYGLEYTVVGRKGINKVWAVQYKESGNTYECKEGLILKGHVLDKNHPKFKELEKEYIRRKSIEWYEKNRESAIDAAKTYQKNNLDRARIKNQKRRAKRKKIGGSHTLEEIEQMLEDQNCQCNCCGEILTKSNKHLDHIMPVALGGSNSIENLQWLCQFCNISKSDKHPDEWAIYSATEEFKLRRQARLQNSILN